MFGLAKFKILHPTSIHASNSIYILRKVTTAGQGGAGSGPLDRNARSPSLSRSLQNGGEEEAVSVTGEGEVHST